MSSFQSGDAAIRLSQHEPTSQRRHPALILLHGSGGNVNFLLDRFAPTLNQFGVAAYAPHYFDKTGTGRATPEIILDGVHVPRWLSAIRDAVSYVAARPAVDPARIGVLGISLGGYLSMALAATDRRLKAVVELSGGMPPGMETQISGSMPPVLILHGADDPIVPVSEAHRLTQLLAARGVPHEVEILPGETHWFSPAAQARLVMAAGSFLTRHL